MSFIKLLDILVNIEPLNPPTSLMYGSCSNSFGLVMVVLDIMMPSIFIVFIICIISTFSFGVISGDILINIGVTMVESRNISR